MFVADFYRRNRINQFLIRYDEQSTILTSFTNSNTFYSSSLLPERQNIGKPGIEWLGATLLQVYGNRNITFKLAMIIGDTYLLNMNSLK